MRSRMFMAVSCACFFNLTVSLFPTITLAAQETVSKQHASDPVYIRINDQEIRISEFHEIFRNAVRNKFYHGQVPEQELIEFRKKVSSDIIDQILLRQAAQKLDIKPDVKKIEEGLEKYDQRYSKSPNWTPRTEEVKQIIIDRLSQKDIIDQMEVRIKDIPSPSLQQVEQYYADNPDKFTEPKRLHVSVILLPVPPSSLSDAWQEAESVGHTLIERINNGEKFSDIAKEFSAHASSVNGGDLGYLHQDMLEQEPQQAVDKLKINELTPPIRVLRGYTIFQLNDIKPARLNPFDAVKDRAGDLLYRDMQDMTWAQYKAKLRADADVFINEDLIAPEQ